YEVSAYARDKRRCVHNLNYWSFGDYLGIGAGAHAKLTMADGSVRRRWKTRHPRAYLEAATHAARIGGDSVVDTRELPFEYMLNALRLVDGTPLDDFSARTGLAAETLRKPLEAAVARDWLRVDDGRLRATALGQRFLNDVVASFIA
ncbi:MAG TPA: oxygen-independent coproporphyrinogen III oxidase-like protein, partial [Rhodanobacteraceae bacterium]|nr:oxygen-independent coproporphyrinogen III oxidase-like protein [Rhodanobacteraceae bacterium]